jgi:signal transduction histidine kinase
MRIRDAGVGIAGAELARLFDPFARGLTMTGNAGPSGAP